jgi:hypothetical protein
MTDEQAAFIAAAIALQGLATPKMTEQPTAVYPLGDAIAELALNIYPHLRGFTEGRAHDEAQ